MDFTTSCLLMACMSTATLTRYVKKENYYMLELQICIFLRMSTSCDIDLQDSVDHLRKKLMYLVLQMESNLGYDDPVSDDE
uniref:Uncharacterized protein n=1 Tax=Aegilops tauschii subsp. strangulata TaxID=200361 RepID=A0A453B6C6_AEGTS